MGQVALTPKEREGDPGDQARATRARRRPLQGDRKQRVDVSSSALQAAHQESNKRKQTQTQGLVLGKRSGGLGHPGCPEGSATGQPLGAVAGSAGCARGPSLREGQPLGAVAGSTGCARAPLPEGRVGRLGPVAGSGGPAGEEGAVRWDRLFRRPGGAGGRRAGSGTGRRGRRAQAAPSYASVPAGRSAARRPGAPGGVHRARRRSAGRHRPSGSAWTGCCWAPRVSPRCSCASGGCWRSAAWRWRRPPPSRPGPFQRAMDFRRALRALAVDRRRGHRLVNRRFRCWPARSTGSAPITSNSPSTPRVSLGGSAPSGPSAPSRSARSVPSAAGAADVPGGHPSPIAMPRRAAPHPVGDRKPPRLAAAAPHPVADRKPPRLAAAAPHPVADRKPPRLAGAAQCTADRRTGQPSVRRGHAWSTGRRASSPLSQGPPTGGRSGCATGSVSRSSGTSLRRRRPAARNRSVSSYIRWM